MKISCSRMVPTGWAFHLFVVLLFVNPSKAINNNQIQNQHGTNQLSSSHSQVPVNELPHQPHQFSAPGISAHVKARHSNFLEPPASSSIGQQDGSTDSSHNNNEHKLATLPFGPHQSGINSHQSIDPNIVKIPHQLVDPTDRVHGPTTPIKPRPDHEADASQSSSPMTIDVSSSDANNFDWLFKLHQQDQQQQQNNQAHEPPLISTPPLASNESVIHLEKQQQQTISSTEQSNNIIQASTETHAQSNVNSFSFEHEPRATPSATVGPKLDHGVSDQAVLAGVAQEGAYLTSSASSTQMPTAQTTDFFFSSAERFPNQERAPNAWWALGFGHQYEIANNLTSDDYLEYCAKSDFLVTNKQRALCRSHWKVMQIVARGLRMAIEECQYRFANHRWNCSLSAIDQASSGSFIEEPGLAELGLGPPLLRDSIHDIRIQRSTNNQLSPKSLTTTTIFGDVMKFSNRERSFLNAIFSAGLAHAMTKACSAGELPEECSCDKKVRSRNNKGKVEWVACSDDIDFGSRFSRDFTDDTELIMISSSPNSIDQNNIQSNPMINTHNYEVGRRVFKSATDITCTCQNTSPASPSDTSLGGGGGGLCPIKRCWKHLAPFSDIGDELMRRYERATHVQPSNKDPHKLRPVRRGVRRPKRKDLVFIEDSPNYCDSDSRLGILGTQGRHCNSTSFGPDSCSLLCCGRGYQLVNEKIQENCNCQFVYCCKIVCDKCERNISYDICN